MGRGRPRTKTIAKGRLSSKSTIDRKPIRPLERQRMRPWLFDLLNNNSCSQLVWTSKKDNVFRVAWKHAAGQTFDPKADATLFERWARHTGKYYTGDKPDPKKWKANFRCALNSLLDVEEDKVQGVRKGNNAFKVYRFLDEKRAKKVSPKKSKDADQDDLEPEFEVLRNIGTRSRPKIGARIELDSEGSESPSHDSSHSDWDDMTSDDVRCHDREMESEKSPLPNFDQLCQSANIFGTTCDKDCSLERRAGSISPRRVPETYSPQRSAELEAYTPYTHIVKMEEEVSNASSSPTDDEIVETIQEMFEEEDGGRCQNDFWTSIMHNSYLIQEAPEEIVGADDFLPQSGPNVIVMIEGGTQDYLYTSMADL